jgi:hypothetical protein
MSRSSQLSFALAIPPPHTTLIEWRIIYAWLRRHSSHSAWAARTAEYLEVAERRLIETERFVEGTLTQFSGFPFGRDHPFTYLEGKRILGLALNELRSRRDLRARLGMNLEASGRPAITGRHGDAVWDFLPLNTSAEGENFTKFPHLTLGILSHAIEAMVTVPNAVNSLMRRNLVELGEDGFADLVSAILRNLNPLLRKHNGATPWFRGAQRRYRTQKSRPYVDAAIDFDLRTAVPSKGPPKTQPRWLSAGYGSFVSKMGTNYQMQLGVIFRYDRCPELERTDALDLVASAWLACEPLVRLNRTASRPVQSKR